MTPPPTFKPDDIELVPDAWGRFERAVDTVSKSGPQHRSNRPQPQSSSADPGDENWTEWGFYASPASPEAVTLGPSQVRTEQGPQWTPSYRYREHLDGSLEISLIDPEG